ncbi:hypothetical protein KAW44_03625 [Candidatus Bipolaricaulota bacterium]|nr:hypothetical protein [Candidatus Bipolaricaulota bacterium]
MKDTVDRAELAACECLEFLSALKSGHGRERLSPQQFQIRLAEEIFRMDEARREVIQEERVLVARKECLSAKWFRTRIRTLGSYKAALHYAIDTLASIGDAFAWIFYMKSPGFLEQHLQKPAQPPPPGIGGRGELEFLRGVPEVAGMHVLSHRITSFLRVGDISLIDPSSLRVAALGELKTSQVEPGRLMLRMEVVGRGEAGKTQFEQKFGTGNAQSPGDKALPTEIQRKLTRQVAEMKAMFSGLAPATWREELSAGHYFDELSALGDTLRKRAVAYVQAGQGLLLIGIRNRARRSLWTRLQMKDASSLISKIDDLPKRTMGILLKQDIELNSLFIGELDTKLFPRGTPLWWWPIDPEFLTDIYLKRVLVFSIYNPAYLIRQVLRDGFQIRDTTAKFPDFHMPTSEGAEIQLGNFSFYISAIQRHLLREEAVISTIHKAIEKLHELHPMQTTRIDIVFNQFAL